MLAKRETSEPARAFLSLYGGASRCALAANRLEWDALVWDKSHAECNDLCLKKVQRGVAQALAVLPVGCVGIEMVCSTWGLARRAPRWSAFPSAVRSNEYLFGLPGLDDRDAKAVKAGNLQFYHAVGTIKKCIELGIPGYLENPRGSRVWFTPQIRRLVRKRLVVLVRADFCQYGTQWMKPTIFLVWGPNRFSVQLKTCSRCAGRCSATGKRHLVLSGSKGGSFSRQQHRFIQINWRKV